MSGRGRVDGLSEGERERRALEPAAEATTDSMLSVPGVPGIPAAVRATSVPPPIAPGSVVKHYEILQELGQGGMGGVFLARDTRLARLCAIKFMLEYTGAGAGRFLAEAQATARCKHESIVTIYEVDEVDLVHRYPYMVLEYLEGNTLRAWMAARASGRAEPGVAVELLLPVVRALVYAHDLGIVHRDLKPENVFVTTTGQVKVLDFGVAKRMDTGEMAGAIASAQAYDTAPGLTTQGALIGTMQYMSPEQWLGTDITPQSDIWAVGIVLYELVTGSHPLAPASMPQLIEVQDLDTPMPSVHARRPDVGPLGAVIDRCLKKHRSERIGSARELLTELERLAAAPRATAAVGQRRRRWLVALVAAGVVAGGAAIAVLRRTDLPGRRAAPARSTGTAITDIPLPASPSPEAQAAYDAALHGFRDANWSMAEAQLRRAIALDPRMAAAQLRLALLLNYTSGRVPETRQSYALAVQWRTALSDRDREILATFDPLFSREPPELARFTAQLDDLARRHPDDAEILALLAWFSISGPEVQLRAARRAVEVDPGYADAWQVIGKRLFTLGRIKESLQAFDACLTASPAAIDCLGERAQIYAAQGMCAAAEADLRNAAAVYPEGRYWRDLWASSLIALGKPVESAIEALRRKWAAQTETRRELVTLHDRARIDLLRGRFDDVRAGAMALKARAGDQPDADQHARYARLLIDVALETDQPADAAEVADEYLRRRGAWLSENSILDDIEMLTVLRDTGRLSADEFDARRQTWLADHHDLAGSVRNQVWLAVWARPAITPDAARAALAHAPTGDLPAVGQSLAEHAVLGTVLLRAGRTAEAIPFLERAAYGCDGFVAPAEHIRAAAELGRALEAAGDRAGACAAYQRVLVRWGAPSVTAREAQRRTAILGCASTGGVTR